MDYDFDRNRLEDTEIWLSQHRIGKRKDSNIHDSSVQHFVYVINSWALLVVSPISCNYAVFILGEDSAACGGHGAACVVVPPFQ